MMTTTESVTCFAPFKVCSVTVYETYIVTHFHEDNSESHFHPPLDDPEFQEAAKYAGYVDPWRHAVEHDIAHAIVADELGWPHSWAVWSAAHGKGDPRPMEQWSQRVKDEEHLVVSLQRFANTGLVDDYGLLAVQFSPLRGVAQRLIFTARPWLIS